MPHMSAALRHPLAGYALAIVAAGVTTLVTLALRPFLHPFVAPPFLVVVLLVAWKRGFGPALAAGAVSVAAFAFLFITPDDPVVTDEADVAATVVFLAALAGVWVAAIVPWSREERPSLFARADARDGRRLDLVEAVERTVGLVMRTSEERFFKVEIAEPVWVEADTRWLDRALVTLLGNAAKATPRGGTVIVRVAADGPSALVEVRDSDVPGRGSRLTVTLPRAPRAAC